MATTHITHSADGTTIVRVVLDEGEAWNTAHVIVCIRKPTHEDDVAYVDLASDNDGSLEIMASDAAGNDDGWGNTYPEYFSDEMMEKVS